MAIETRALGRTGADVTVLGYGAMELRGAPRGPEVTDEHAGRSAALQAAGTLIRGGAARGAPAQDKNWRTGPLGVPQGVGQRRWQEADVDDLIADSGMSGIEFTLRFTLSHPSLSTTIVGTSSLEHLASNIAIAEKGPLPADLYAEARKRLAA